MALWSKDKLRERANRRLAAREILKPAEQAALAWARWQGMTDEAGLDRQQVKADLDRLVDAMEPEEWKPLYSQSGTLDDAAMRGVLLYSVKRAEEQVRQSSELPLEQSPAPDDSPTPPASAPARKRRMEM